MLRIRRVVPQGSIPGFVEDHHGKRILIHAMIATGHGMAAGDKNSCIGVANDFGWELLDLAGNLPRAGGGEDRVNIAPAPHTRLVRLQYRVSGCEVRGGVSMKLALNHLNLPARDPEALRRWYIERLGFEAHGRFLWSHGTLLVFVPGEPLGRNDTHFGFRVDTVDKVREWARRFGEPARGDDTYCTVFVTDPEGNRFEIFWEPLHG